jgi:hypothetical protein
MAILGKSLGEIHCRSKVLLKLAPGEMAIAWSSVCVEKINQKA